MKTKITPQISFSLMFGKFCLSVLILGIILLSSPSSSWAASLWQNEQATSPYTDNAIPTGYWLVKQIELPVKTTIQELQLYGFDRGMNGDILSATFWSDSAGQPGQELFTTNKTVSVTGNAHGENLQLNLELQEQKIWLGLKMQQAIGFLSFDQIDQGTDFYWKDGSLTRLGRSYSIRLQYHERIIASLPDISTPAIILPETNSEERKIPENSSVQTPQAKNEQEIRRLNLAGSTVELPMPVFYSSGKKVLWQNEQASAPYTDNTIPTEQSNQWLVKKVSWENTRQIEEIQLVGFDRGLNNDLLTMVVFQDNNNQPGSVIKSFQHSVTVTPGQTHQETIRLEGLPALQTFWLGLRMKQAIGFLSFDSQAAGTDYIYLNGNNLLSLNRTYSVRVLTQQAQTSSFPLTISVKLRGWHDGWWNSLDNKQMFQGWFRPTGGILINSQAGRVDSGYGVILSRSGGNWNNSRVIFRVAGQDLILVKPGYEFEDWQTLTATFFADGAISWQLKNNQGQSSSGGFAALANLPQGPLMALVNTDNSMGMEFSNWQIFGDSHLPYPTNPITTSQLWEGLKENPSALAAPVSYNPLNYPSLNQLWQQNPTLAHQLTGYATALPVEQITNLESAAKTLLSLSSKPQNTSFLASVSLNQLLSASNQSKDNYGHSVLTVGDPEKMALRIKEAYCNKSGYLQDPAYKINYPQKCNAPAPPRLDETLISFLKENLAVGFTGTVSVPTPSGIVVPITVGAQYELDWDQRTTCAAGAIGSAGYGFGLPVCARFLSPQDKNAIVFYTPPFTIELGKLYEARLGKAEIALSLTASPRDMFVSWNNNSLGLTLEPSITVSPATPISPNRKKNNEDGPFLALTLIEVGVEAKLPTQWITITPYGSVMVPTYTPSDYMDNWLSVQVYNNTYNIKMPQPRQPLSRY